MYEIIDKGIIDVGFVLHKIIFAKIKATNTFLFNIIVLNIFFSVILLIIFYLNF